MYVRNFKLNGKMIFKIVFVILTILIFIMFGIGVINIINSNERITSKSEGVPQSEINTISAANYTNVLKTVHDNMNQYIGKKIKFVDVWRKKCHYTILLSILIIKQNV